MKLLMLLIDWIWYSLVFIIFLLASYVFLPSLSFHSFTSDLGNFPSPHPLIPNLIPCMGEKHRKPSKEELERIFDNHSKWLKDPQNGQQAILCGLDLNHLDLSKINLRKAVLEGVDLTGATLHGAIFDEAWLNRTIFKDAGLADSSFIKADLTGASFENAFLVRANFEKAILHQTNLKNASVFWANFHFSLFEPLPGHLPYFDSMISANNLSNMRYLGSAEGLRELRKQFKEAGLSEKERELTFAIKRSNRYKMWPLENFFDWLFFDLTCQYGLSQGKPLQILFWLIFPFSVFYSFAIQSKGTSGIWAVSSWQPNLPEKKDWPIRVTPEFFFPKFSKKNIFRTQTFTLLGSFYFSLLSAFNIGWRELTLGTWITRLQTREYSLKPIGWVRTVSGVQSLISLYLLVLWFLVYFTRPFE